MPRGIAEPTQEVHCMNIEAKLEQMGLKLPAVAKPVAAYVPTVRTGNYVYTSGQLPLVEGKLSAKGQLGADISLEDAYAGAKICALNCLAAIKAEIGDLAKVKRVVKVVGFVNSVAGYDAQPKVINGASEFLVEVFGDAGKHARSAVGVSGLPMGAAVEVEMVVEVE
jgi:enamine deaminase RidA (YjgF/YER057c/UK114 family)